MSKLTRSGKKTDYSDKSVEAAQDSNVDVTADAALAATPTDHPSADPPSNGNDDFKSPAFLTGLAKWHPAIGAFQFLADCHFPKDMPAYKRFTSLIERHPGLYKSCLVVDAVVMVLILFGLGAAAARIGWITLMR